MTWRQISTTLTPQISKLSPFQTGHTVSPSYGPINHFFSHRIRVRYVWTLPMLLGSFLCTYFACREPSSASAALDLLPLAPVITIPLLLITTHNQWKMSIRSYPRPLFHNSVLLTMMMITWLVSPWTNLPLAYSYTPSSFPRHLATLQTTSLTEIYFCDILGPSHHFYIPPPSLTTYSLFIFVHISCKAPITPILLER
jgi:hypothetical protein